MNIGYMGVSRVVYHLHEKTIWLEIVQMERKNFN